MMGTTFSSVSYTTLHAPPSGHGCHLITAGGGYGPYVSADQMLQSQYCVGFQPQWPSEGLAHGPAPNVGYQLPTVERSHLERCHVERFAPKCRIASVQDPTGEALPVEVKAGESILNFRARAAIHFNVAQSQIDLLLGNEDRSLDDECLIVLGICGCDHAVQVVVRHDTPLQAIAREARLIYEYSWEGGYGTFEGFVGLPFKDKKTGCVRVTLQSEYKENGEQRDRYISEGVFDSGKGKVTLTKKTKNKYVPVVKVGGHGWRLTKLGFMPEEVSQQISDELADELCRPWEGMRTIALSFADESTGAVSIQCFDIGGMLLSTVTVSGESRLDSLYNEIAGALGISQDLLQLVLPDGTLGKTLPASKDLESIRDRHGSS